MDVAKSNLITSTVKGQRNVCTMGKSGWKNLSKRIKVKVDYEKLGQVGRNIRVPRWLLEQV